MNTTPGNWSAPTAPPPPPPPPGTPAYAGGFQPASAHGGQLPAGVSIASPWTRLGSYLLEVVLISVTLGIGWLIWAATTAGNGQTPAKRLLKLRVIGADTMQPASFGKMFWVRGIVAGFVAQIAILFTVGILLFMPFWDKRRQNLWDKVSNTYVVNDASDAWATNPDLRY